MDTCCQCCFNARNFKMRPIDGLLKSIFSEMLPNFKLNDGVVCPVCYSSLTNYHNFKTKITLVHEQFSFVQCKIEPLDDYPNIEAAPTVDIDALCMEVKVEDYQETPVIIQSYTMPLYQRRHMKKLELPLPIAVAPRPILKSMSAFAEEKPELKQKLLKSLSFRSKIEAVSSVQVKLEPSDGDFDRFTCNFCNFHCGDNETFRHHFETFHKDKLVCEFCDHISTTEKCLIAHQNKEHSATNGFKCIECRIVLTSFELLKGHMKQHKPPPGQTSSTEVCPICGKYFVKPGLKTHMKLVHQKLKAFECQTCGNPFKAKAELKSHILIHHSGGIKQFNCDICGIRFATRKQIFLHIRSKHLPRILRFKCQYCHKAFAQKGNYKSHLTIHRGAGDLYNGLKVNSATNNYHCLLCPRQFARMRGFLEHMQGKKHRNDFVKTE